MESKTLVFGQDGANSNLLATLAPLLQQKGMDPNVLAMMNNNGFGGNNFIWVLFLLVLFGGWGNGGFGNGWGNGNNGAGFLANQLNNTEGRDLLMQAIQGNHDALNQLSSTLQVNATAVQNGFSQVMQSLCNIGNQVGMTGQQVINALQNGNMQIAQQIANATSQSQLQMCQATGQLTSAICDAKTGLNNTLTMLGFQSERQTCDLKGTIRDQIDKVVAGQTAAEMREMQAVINHQSDELQSYKTAGIVSQQLAPIGTALTNLKAEFAAFQAKQPTTFPVQYQPFVAVPNGIAYGYGLGTGSNTGFWGA